MFETGEELLARLLAAAPRPEGAPGGDTIDTSAVIRRLAERPTDLAANRADLMALCRKLEVGGAVREVYGPGWRRIADAAPTAIAWRALFAAALLATADQHLEADDARARAAALKCLNAALKAVDDLRDGGDPPVVDALAAWARHLLDARVPVPAP
jgi:hypothetical protein